MTCSKKFMTNYKVFSPIDVHLADDGVVQAIGCGDIMMSMKTPMLSIRLLDQPRYTGKIPV